MFRHVLLLTMRDDADDTQVNALVDALRSLPAQIPEIVSYRTGRDLGLRDDTADVAIVGEYADE
ncbi:MAG: Dabb family protein, partial [Candidatus Neomicrothrix subdominans]